MLDSTFYIINLVIFYFRWGAKNLSLSKLVPMIVKLLEDQSIPVSFVSYLIYKISAIICWVSEAWTINWTLHDSFHDGLDPCY